ncbi:MAG: cytidine deaminase [Crenarchaeota archaeon]|nr:cytidine deaminase [Thermoproteota archaeon]MCR8462957.1 cytidine deaminase [Thermoproteota archaeon]MCR8471128.1 cytidine deaminase [Thermoproteota archaeon]MCR8471423.1 cytidine deaminase [Thermoproteota archaeon]MCR8487064.1 cytidine deaminase [Thermoproteota archaeon]
MARELFIERFLEIAKQYIQNSYAPYSRIRVSAVLETDKGYFVGVNIENASYGLTVCAERVAFFKAISEGAKKFYRILIYSPDINPSPCGACRQVMSEFVDDNFEVIICSEEGEPVILELSELLPYKFSTRHRR